MKLPTLFTESFIYVDCGAVGDFSNPLLDIFPNSRYVGFDPELSVPLEKGPSSVYFPVALAREAGIIEFHRTQNPNCSSFFVPNQEFLDCFMQVGEFFRIIDTVPLKVAALDEYLPRQGINDIDFIELDTQGSELHILQGAERFVRSGIIGVRVEVEFSAMYQDQPLFADVDAFLRQHGFMLFDLDRYHLRRKTASGRVSSREQIVWGQALYFKDWRNVAAAFRRQKLVKLAMVASYYGFHSYTLEIMEYLLSVNVEILTVEEKAHLKENIIAGNRLTRETRLKKLIVLNMKKVYGFLKAILARVKGIAPSSQTGYFWKD